MSNVFEKANERFLDFKNRNNFVVVEKHGGALRNSYAEAVPAAIPDVVLCDTPAWSELQPKQVFATEDYAKDRCTFSLTDKRNALEDCIDYISSAKAPVIYSWFHSSQVEALAQATGAEAVVSRDEIVCGIIEDKTLLQTHLQNAGCENAALPQHVIFSSSSELSHFDVIREKFDIPFVLQGRSMGGDGTFIVTSKEEFIYAREHARGAIRLSEFIDASYSSIYALALPDPNKESVSVYIDVPSYKPVNVPELGIGNVAGAGGDWRTAREDLDIESIIQNVEKIARYFYKRWKYFGHFVVEGFHKEGQFIFNEINARPGGGSEVNGNNQLERGVPPFTLLHILGRLGLANSSIYESGLYNEETALRVHQGSRVGVFYLKYKNNHGMAMQPGRGYHGSGIYKLVGDELIWQRDSISSRQANIDAGEILIANGPQTGATIEHGKQACTLEGYGTRPLMDNGLKLNHTGKKIAAAVCRLLQRD